MIRVDRTGEVATITIDRGGSGNSFSGAGWDALTAGARDLTDSDATVVVLRSAAPLFSAGADLTEMAALIDDPAARVTFRTRMRAAIDAVATLPMPVIAAIDGGCFGAAVALVLASDLCIAGDSARFATTPAKLGIGYPGEDVARLIARVGRGQAARMLLTAAPIDADEAHRIGLADVRATHAGDEADQLAGAIGANAPTALRSLKRTLNDPARADAALDFDALFGTPDFATRLAAFHARAR
ncbi:enoyl-CoA hydratase/isomerase family protein [Sphingomonas donggukensis]|uniref:Enoyl-CoA hydratase/isomerase family protein n=1 Tax=Sphingomonas donggukensis TaxID=2949093 RepID=A0ABY4TY61_9SPHN|nr:enoyl-CoA hydratase/isomerase family protein [Sphingomonas donggukensis]URW76467.1 enoyl-CoA hydratase/isomerase family protein [Sphingomonas donggukensis]